LTSNHLLDALPDDARTALVPRLVRARLRAGLPLHRANEVALHVYFPTTAVVALRHELDAGQSMHLALIDRRGMVGHSVLMGVDTTTAAVLVGGDAWRLESGHLIGEFERSAAVRQRLLGWIQVVLTQVVWSSTCHRYHRPDRRLCTRLAQLAAGPDGQDIPLTQRQLGDLVGVRRERVNEVLGQLLRGGWIAQRRGHVTLVDLESITRHACDCHGPWRQALDRNERADR
jgi:CRP-like cAMP-binding protein